MLGGALFVVQFQGLRKAFRILLWLDFCAVSGFEQAGKVGIGQWQRVKVPEVVCKEGMVEGDGVEMSVWLWC